MRGAVALCALVALAALLPASARTPVAIEPGPAPVVPAAFPGAEGFGAEARGGRGGRVVHVTTLADSGAGSLRWALETVSGPRIVVFDVAGTIALRSQILLEDGRVTIAGQSAPGEGITITGARLRIKASEVIVRGLHFRPGDSADGMDPGNRDGLMVGTTDFTITRVVIDHNSFAWAIDENLTLNGHMDGVTVSNNIIARGLSRSLHPKGEHSRGMLVSNWEGTRGDEARRISIVGNLFADNMLRNPEVRAGQDVEIVNNYIVDFGHGNAAMALGGGSAGTLVTRMVVLGNVFEAGRATAGNALQPIKLGAMARGSTVLFGGNLRLQGDAREAVALVPPTGAGAFAATLPQRTPGGARLWPASGVRRAVLEGAGAVTCQGRDAADRDLLADVAAGRGRIVDRPDLRREPAPVASLAIDSDRDGMPDWYEHRVGLDPMRPDDAQDRDHNGYSDIEDYLNAIVTAATGMQDRVVACENGALR